jgi:hypothetical protein
MQWLQEVSWLRSVMTRPGNPTTSCSKGGRLMSEAACFVPSLERPSGECQVRESLSFDRDSRHSGRPTFTWSAHQLPVRWEILCVLFDLGLLHISQIQTNHLWFVIAGSKSRLVPRVSQQCWPTGT